MLPKKQFKTALIFIAAIVGFTLAAVPRVKNVDPLDASIKEIEEPQELSSDRRGNQASVLMVDGNDRFGTGSRYSLEAKANRNMPNDSMYKTSSNINENKVNSSVKGVRTIYIYKGIGNHSNTYVAGSNKATVQEEITDNFGVVKTEASNSVKDLGPNYNFKTIRATNVVEGKLVNKKVEGNGGSYKVQGIESGSDALNTRVNDGDNGTKIWTDVKGSRTSDSVENIMFNVRDGETRTSVKRPGVTYEISSPSTHQEEPFVETTNKRDILDRIFAIPTNIRRTVNMLLNLKHQIMQDFNVNFGDTNLEETIGNESKYKQSTGDVGTGEPEKTGPLVTMQKKISKSILNIPNTILKSVRNLFKCFVQ